MNNTRSKQSGNTWINKDEITTGNWSIISKGNEIILIFKKNFQTPDGPDLKLYLSTIKMEDIGVNDAIHRAGLLIDNLKAIKGKQEYNLPNKKTLSNYKSLVIHCEKYTVVWGGINLH